MLGAVLGSVTALSLDEELLQRLFAVLILVVAARLLMTGRSGNQPSETDDHERYGDR